MKNKKQWMISIYLISFMIMVIGLFFLSGKEQRITYDSAYYIHGARNIAAGNGFSIQKYHEDGKVKLEPITKYQPLYSFFISIPVLLFNADALMSSKMINHLFWFAGMLICFCIYSKLFGLYSLNTLGGMAFLLFSSGLWTYTNAALSETVFIFFLFLSVLFSVSYTQNTGRRSIMFLLLFGLSTGFCILTRYMGLPFVAAHFLLIFLHQKKNSWGKILKDMLIFCSPLFLTLGFWTLRNKILAGEIASHYAWKKTSNIFDIHRIIEVTNYFLTDSLGLSSSMEKMAFLLIIPLLICFLIILFTNNQMQGLSKYIIWLFIMIFAYSGLIIYTSLLNPDYSRHQGFMRYFFLLQPLWIMALFMMIKSFESIQLKYVKYLRYFLMVFILGTLLIGMNKTRILFSFQIVEKYKKEYFQVAQSNISASSIVLSNHEAKGYIYSGHAVLQVKNKEEILKNLDKFRDHEFFGYFFKDIGRNYRKEFQIYSTMLENLKYNVLFEDDYIIFVKLKQEGKTL